MSTSPNIRYCKRQEIDIRRWDDCIASSANRLIYGFHEYLDGITGKQWDGLILEDYQAVMPLTWRRKYGFNYLAQPAFTQQTGIFSPLAIPPTIIMAFLGEAARRYRFAEIFLNYANPWPGLEARKNIVLSLDKPYDQLCAGYSENLRRILRQSQGRQLVYSGDIRLTEALDTYIRLYGHRNPATKDQDYRRFAELCGRLLENGKLILRAAGRQAQWFAMALLVKDANRLYLLQSTTLPTGREIGANHFLLDGLIREFAGQPLLLDFEGSDDPGVGRFYASFGGADQPYFFWRHNRLPWPASLFKHPSAKTPLQRLGRQE